MKQDIYVYGEEVVGSGRINIASLNHSAAQGWELVACVPFSYLETGPAEQRQMYYPPLTVHKTQLIFKKRQSSFGDTENDT